MADSCWLEHPVEPLPRPAWDGRADVIISGGSVWAVLGEHAPVLDQLDPARFA